MLGVISQIRDGYKRLRKQEEDQIGAEVDKIRQKIVKGCNERMEHGIFEASFKCYLMIIPRTRADLQERCRRKLEDELRQSLFKDTEVYLNDGTAETDNGKPSVVISLNWKQVVELDQSELERNAFGQGNVVLQCAICMSQKLMCALTPCGHMCCAECQATSADSMKCPFCRCQVSLILPLFNSAETLASGVSAQQQPPTSSPSPSLSHPTGEPKPKRARRG